MLKTLLIFFILFIFTACNENKPTKKLDGKKLIESKCASCHDLHMPPLVKEDELAPPMMAVAFHVHSLIEPSNESQRTSEAINFVKDYVYEPSVKKSFCDKYSLNRYGLMESQKGKVTTDELDAIALYMFTNFTQENLTKVQKEKAAFQALAPGKKIALKNRCLGCHGINKKRVGPALRVIAKKFKNNTNEMIKSIKSGSKGQWKSSNGAVMPSFDKISDEDLEVLSKWILKNS